MEMQNTGDEISDGQGFWMKKRKRCLYGKIYFDDLKYLSVCLSVSLFTDMNKKRTILNLPE